MRIGILSLALIVPLLPALAHAECEEVTEPSIAAVSSAVAAANSTDPATHEKELTDAAAADGTLSFKEANKIVFAPIKDGLDTKSLKVANKFLTGAVAAALTAETRDINGNPVDSLGGAIAVVQALYWGMPRDFRGLEGSGQTIAEFSKMDSTMYFLSDRPEHPFTLRVKGTAEKDYTMKFRLAERDIAVKVKQGETPAQVAKKVAAAITKKSDAVAKSALDAGSWHWESDAYITGISATSSGGLVTITPAIDS